MPLQSDDDTDHENSGDVDPSGSQHKRRKIHKACDYCRSKKVRCDGGDMPRNQCTNCISTKRECTYVSQARRSGPTKSEVDRLQREISQVGKLLAKLAPHIDVEHELSLMIPPPATNNRRGKKSSASSTAPNSSASPQSVPPLVPERHKREEESEASDDEYAALRSLSHDIDQRFKVLTLEGNKFEQRFHGKSSALNLLHSSKKFKSEMGISSPKLSAIRNAKWSPEFEEEMKRKHRFSGPKDVEFPPSDLTEHLFDNFFRRLAPFYPLIHRPTFEACYRDGLHFRDSKFAALVMIVCAVGSLYSSDPRVMKNKDAGILCAGYMFVVTMKKLLDKTALDPMTLTDLRIIFLAAYYHNMTGSAHICWIVVGIGIRHAQDIGHHLEMMHKNAPILEREQIKRVFWCFLSLDRESSAYLGHPLACQDEDYDISYPEEVDDEYMTETGFAQPSTVISQVSYFNCSLRLSQITAHTLRTIYSAQKAILGYAGTNWEQDVVAELDSSMNEWFDSVPDHLRWDPARENQIHFEQSARLYANYYHLQIMIHRPFIPTPNKPSPLLLPSLAICTNAARACASVVERVGKRVDRTVVFPDVVVAGFNSAVVILFSLWGAKEVGMSISQNDQVRDVAKCIQCIANSEGSYWEPAKWALTILRRLASYGDVSFPAYERNNSHKRTRPDDEVNLSQAGPSPPTPPDRVFVGESDRYNHGTSTMSGPSSSSSSIHGIPFSSLHALDADLVDWSLPSASFSGQGPTPTSSQPPMNPTSSFTSPPSGYPIDTSHLNFDFSSNNLFAPTRPSTLANGNTDGLPLFPSPTQHGHGDESSYTNISQPTFPLPPFSEMWIGEDPYPGDLSDLNPSKFIPLWQAEPWQLGVSEERMPFGSTTPLPSTSPLVDLAGDLGGVGDAGVWSQTPTNFIWEESWSNFLTGQPQR